MAARHTAELAGLAIPGSSSNRPIDQPHGVGAVASLLQDQPRMGSDEGKGLRGFLLDRYKRGTLPASTLAALCWHATRAGAANVADLASSPSDSEHAADHVRRAIAARAKDTFYVAKIPMKCSDEVGEQRRLVDFPMNLPHEDFARQYKEDAGQFQISLHGQFRVPPSYSLHPVVVGKGDMACPVGLFFGWGPPYEKGFLHRLVLEQFAFGEEDPHMRPPQIRLLQVRLPRAVRDRGGAANSRMVVRCAG